MPLGIIEQLLACIAKSYGDLEGDLLSFQLSDKGHNVAGPFSHFVTQQLVVVILARLLYYLENVQFRVCALTEVHSVGERLGTGRFSLDNEKHGFGFDQRFRYLCRRIKLSGLSICNRGHLLLQPFTETLEYRFGRSSLVQRAGLTRMFPRPILRWFSIALTASWVRRGNSVQHGGYPILSLFHRDLLSTSAS